MLTNIPLLSLKDISLHLNQAHIILKWNPMTVLGYGYLQKEIYQAKNIISQTAIILN